jgi:hypothetical protein
LVQTLERYGPDDAALQRSAGLLLGVMIWFASPGLLLVANTAIYHEPTAMAYLFMACFLALLAQVVLFEKPIGSVLLPLALFAGLSVYGRPHLAVGLYAGSVSWPGSAVAEGLARPPPRGGRDGHSVLLRSRPSGFQRTALRQHASTWQRQRDEHAIRFWEHRKPSTHLECSAFAEHGRFNAYRIVPNLMLYLFDMPAGALSDGLERAFRYMTSGLGYIRIEHPGSAWCSTGCRGSCWRWRA